MSSFVGKNKVMAVDVAKQQLMFSLIEIWKQGDQTQREFCREKDLDYHQFQYWFRRYKRISEPTKEQGSSFTQITVKKREVSASTVELIFPDGRKLIFHQGVEASFLKSLLG